MKEATSACHPSHINSAQQQPKEHHPSPSHCIEAHHAFLCGEKPEKGETMTKQNTKNKQKKNPSSFASNRPGNIYFIGQEEEGGREGFHHRSTPSRKLLPGTPVNEEDLALGGQCVALAVSTEAAPIRRRSVLWSGGRGKDVMAA